MFEFKLQSVLNAKKAKEEEMLVEYRNFLQEIKREKQALKEMRKEREMMIDKLRKDQNRPISTDEIAISYTFIEQFGKKIKEKEEQIEAIKSLAEKKRQTLISVMKERKILEKLKEKHFKEFKQQVKLKEKIFFDESAILRFARNNHE